MLDTLGDLSNFFRGLPLLIILVFFKGPQTNKQYPASLANNWSFAFLNFFMDPVCPQVYLTSWAVWGNESDFLLETLHRKE